MGYALYCELFAERLCTEGCVVRYVLRKVLDFFLGDVKAYLFSILHPEANAGTEKQQ